MPRRMIPVAEIWIQSDGDLGNDLMSLARFSAHLHVDVVDRETVIRGLKWAIECLEGSHDKMIFGKNPALIDP